MEFLEFGVYCVPYCGMYVCNTYSLGLIWVYGILSGWRYAQGWINLPGTTNFARFR